MNSGVSDPQQRGPTMLGSQLKIAARGATQHAFVNPSVHLFAHCDFPCWRNRRKPDDGRGWVIEPDNIADGRRNANTPLLTASAAGGKLPTTLVSSPCRRESCPRSGRPGGRAHTSGRRTHLNQSFDRVNKMVIITANTLAGARLAFQVAEGFMALSRALAGPENTKKQLQSKRVQGQSPERPPGYL